MRRSTFSIAAMLSMVLLLHSVPSLAQALPAAPSTPGTKWTWQAPPECPSEAVLQKQIEKHLGRSLAATESAVESVSATVRRSGESLELTIEMDAGGDRRERRLEHQDCLALANAASVIVAIVLDPSSAEHLAEDLEAAPLIAQEAGKDQEANPAQISGSKKSSPKDGPSSESATSSELNHARLQLQLQAALSALIGPLPEPSLGAELAVGLVSTRWRSEFYGGTWLAQTMALPQLEDAESRFFLWSLGIRSGPTLKRGPWAWTIVSLGAEAGRYSVKSTGLESARTSNTLWAAATLGSALHVAVSDRLHALLRLEGLLTLRSNVYTAENYGTLYAPERFGGRLQLGFSWSLGAE